MAQSSQTNESQHTTVYIGTFVHTPKPSNIEILHETAIGVDDTGTIIFIVPYASLADQKSSLASQAKTQSTYTEIDLRPSARSTRFVFPGFIDTHTHASQYPNAGIFGNSTLLDWLDTYTFPLESSFADARKAAHVYRRAVARSLAHGTTCAAYYATVHIDATNLLARTCVTAGQRALIGRVCMDRMSPADYRDPSPAAAVEATASCAAYCASLDPPAQHIKPVVTPRFAPSCCAETMAGLAVLAEKLQCPVQTHISENASEIALVAELFPGAKHYTDVYDTAGLLTERTILAHGVHFSDEEIALIRQRGTGVSHCPASNTALTSGACNVRKLLDAGVKVGLGTDVSGGYSSSILEMVRQAMLVSRHVAMAEGVRYKLDLSEALYLGTKGGAELVGFGERTGSFEIGRYFDAQLIQMQDYGFEEGAKEKSDPGFEAEDQGLGRPVDVFGWESWEDRVAKWAWCGDDRNVVCVWVGGKMVYKEAGYTIQ